MPASVALRRSLEWPAQTFSMLVSGFVYVALELADVVSTHFSVLTGFSGIIHPAHLPQSLCRQYGVRALRHVRSI